MHIITKRRLRDFWRKYPDAQSSLEYWYTLTKAAQWQNPAELKLIFPTADLVGRLTVFNIAGNKYRLIARIEYRWQKVYIRHVLIHAEYDKGNWKNET